MTNNGYKREIFVKSDESIKTSAYVGNGHGVHTNMFPVNYMVLFDFPDNILFRTSRCIISSAYCRLSSRQEDLINSGVTVDEVVDKIAAGILWKGVQGLCHTELATKECVMTYLKYVTENTSTKYDLRVYSFDDLLAFETRKTRSRISSGIEQELFNKIINLKDIESGFALIEELNKVENVEFRSAALLLLKCKVYDIEDMHYMQSKVHDKKDKEQLKVYRRMIFPQV